jgi:hypothetical protein
MALITNDRVRLQWSDGIASRASLFIVIGATTADTIDLSAYFSKIEKAFFIPRTGTAAPAVATISANTTLTLTVSGLSNDANLLVAVGAAF